MVAIPNSAFFGVPPLGTISGAAVLYPPHWAIVDSNEVATLTTTATRLYFIPYYFSEVVSFTGLKSRNSGAADNGKTYRCGVYQKSPTTNLPSTLIQDCGEVTLTGASAERTLATAFTPAYIGWHYLAFHANTGAVMVRMASQMPFSDAGIPGGISLSNAFGVSAANVRQFGAYYVDTAYGALASTAVAPTAVTNLSPVLMPYRT